MTRHKASSGRVLSLDYGQQRIGVAISDSGRVIAQALEPPVKNNSTALPKLQSLIQKYEIAEIILGLPISLSGMEGRAAEKARGFAKLLQAHTGLPVHLIDERLTTRQARSMLKTAGFGQDRKRYLVDNLSALVLLQSYLDAQKKMR